MSSQMIRLWACMTVRVRSREVLMCVSVFFVTRGEMKSVGWPLCQKESLDLKVLKCPKNILVQLH